jgi:predicted nuclease of predicted toxin-antitoxin system
MRFIVDMNLSPQWVDHLTGSGIEAVHWSSIGSPRATDREIMQSARERSAVVLTHDPDFSALLAVARSTGPSVVQLRTRDVLPSACGAALVGAVRQHAAAIEHGAIVTVDMLGARVRILPLGEIGK